MIDDCIKCDMHPAQHASLVVESWPASRQIDMVYPVRETHLTAAACRGHHEARRLACCRPHGRGEAGRRLGVQDCGECRHIGRAN